jgi:hypothetical protein
MPKKTEEKPKKSPNIPAGHFSVRLMLPDEVETEFRVCAAKRKVSLAEYAKQAVLAAVEKDSEKKPRRPCL